MTACRDGGMCGIGGYCAICPHRRDERDAARHRWLRARMLAYEVAELIADGPGDGSNTHAQMAGIDRRIDNAIAKEIA